MAADSAPAQPPSRSSAAGDAWGGFAAMLVALPSAIAYGVAVYAPLGDGFVGHGVRAGIIGTIVLGLVAALVDGSPRLISAPCAPAAAVLAALVTGMLADGGGVSPERIMVLLTLVALFTGILQLAYGAIGGGRLIKFIPFPVVSGYLSSVGVIIFIGQLPKFLGAPHGVSLGGLVADPSLWRWPGIVVGVAAIAAVVFASRLTKAVPAPILGLAAGLLAYFALALARPELLRVTDNPLVLGPVGGGGSDLLKGMAGPWLAITGATLADVRELTMPALTLSVLLSIDTLKTCVVVDALTRGRHNSNRTLLGQGAGNVAAALTGGMPGAGTMGATLVNIESGGRTPLSGVIQGLCALAVAVVLGRWIAWVPVAALAGILMVVAVRMFDWGSFHLLRQKSTVLDFGVIATVIVVAVGWSLIAAAGVGVGLAILLFIREQIRGSVIRRKIPGNRISSTQHRLPAEQAVLERRGAETCVVELQGSLFFGTTDQLHTELTADLQRIRYLILDLRRVQSMDYTAAHLFHLFETMLAERNGWLVFSRLPVRRDLQAYFEQVGVVASHRRVRKCETLDDALCWVEDQILGEELPAPAGNVPPLGLAEFDLTREFEADQTLAPLAACVVERTVPAGQLVFAQGAVADELYLIRRGIVRIVLPLKNGNYHNLASFGRGHIFGEMSFLVRGTRSANALATTDTDLFVISRARFDEVARAHPLVGIKIFARLANTLSVRLRHTDDELRAFYDA